ncbi:MAG: hypothetical protein K2X91_11785, partial [Thermoleophilia bacterium]|nr:hypothetical protein [Thermoleophilia bacterium]
MTATRAQLPGPKAATYSPTATRDFWVGAAKVQREAGKNRAGAFVRALLTGNLAAVRTTAAEGDPVRTEAAAWNLLMKFNDVRAHLLGDDFNEADLQAVAQVLYDGLGLWFAAAGIEATPGTEQVSSDFPRSPYWILGTGGNSNVARALRAIRQRSGQSGLRFCVLPSHVVRLLHSGALHPGELLSLSLSRLMTLDDEPRALESTLQHLRVARRLDREQATPYLGQFVLTSGHVVNDVGYSLPGSLGTIAVLEYPLRLLERQPPSIEPRRLVAGTAALVAQAQRTFRGLSDNVRATRRALDGIERALADGVPVTLVRRPYKAHTSWMFRMGTPTPFVAAVLGGRDMDQLAFFGPSVQASDDIGYALDVFEPVLAGALTEARRRWAAAEPADVEARDLLELAVAYARRRMAVS